MTQTCSALSGTVEEGLCLVDCSARTASGGLNVSIDNSFFHIPYNNLIFPQTDSSSAYCQMLLAQAGENETAILGTPFLRSVYAVFDWDNQQVSLGQKANCTSNVVSIGTGSGAVPTTGGCDSESSSGGTRSTLRYFLLAIITGISSLLIVG